MPNYDFKTLSPIDFEILVRDLLQEELGLRLENFKAGRDRGIDLRYCPSQDNTLIVQCKHYAESSFQTLLREIKKHELEKVKKLDPTRYILATSLGLTPDQKDEIMEIYTPFIHAPGDIFGKDELNGLLVKFPKVERYTFKLWLSSVPVFEEILHSKVKNVSRDALLKIKQHAEYYVQNKSFHEAIQILDKHNFCIIAGIPGIGKTILAEMLSLHFVNLGYEIVKISGDISEATGIDYSNQKRVLYYDDFLGQSSLSEKLNKIDHRNYSPRIIDLMTQYSRVQYVRPNDYFNFFISNLEKPLEIWRHAFEEQLAQSSRNLLIVMASLPELIFLENLREAFLSFHLRQAKEYLFETSPDDFIHALKELEGNFISTEKSKDRTVVSFHNPSIRDYLREYLSSHEMELLSLVQAATLYDQHMILWEFREEQSDLLKFRNILIKYNDEFVHALTSSVNFRTCRLINYRASKNSTYKKVWDMTFEDKATLVVSVAFELKTALSMNLLKQVLDVINQRMIDNHADREGLLRFLKELKNRGKASYELSSAFLTNAKKFFITNIDSLDSVDCFLDFKGLFPEVIDNDVFENMKDKFVELALEDVSFSPNDPFFYRDEAYKIEKLAKQFKIDMTDRINDLEEQASELEAERPDESDDYEGYGSGGGSALCSDSDIDSLFGTLQP